MIDTALTEKVFTDILTDDELERIDWTTLARLSKMAKEVQDYLEAARIARAVWDEA